MALASTIETNDGTVTPTGIVIAIMPGSDPTTPIELWRAPDSAGAPNTGSAVLVVSQIVAPGGIHYVDRLPTDGAIYWYQTRMNGNGYGAGPFTEWVNHGAADRLSADVIFSFVAGDATRSSGAWEQQVARPGTHTQQMLPNFGFEDGLAFWAPNAFIDNTSFTIVNNPANAKSGNQYLKVTTTTGVRVNVVIADDVGKKRYFEVNPGDVIQYGGWAYRESGTDNVQFICQGSDKDKIFVSNNFTPAQNTAGWVLVQAQYIVPASGVKYVSFFCDVEGNGTATVARFDDVFFRILIQRNLPLSDGGYALQATTADGLLGNDAGGKLLIDLSAADITVTDGQGSPVTRAKFGKVGAGVTDYGVQVWDSGGATVIDFTGSKRILAVPVQAAVDSGTAVTIDLSTGLTQQVRLTGTATVTLSNPTDGGRYRIWFQQDTTGSRPFPTISGLVMFTNETPPTLTTTPGQMDLFEFEYRTRPTARYTCMTLQTNVTPVTPRIQFETSQAFGSSTTTHNVTMPSTVVAGDLLLIAFETSLETSTAPTTPTGWTQVATQATGGLGRLTLLGKIADGTEGSTNVNVVTNVNSVAAALIMRVDRWYGSLSGVVVTTTSGSSNTPDPPSNTPGWIDDRNLWLALTGMGAAATTNTAPTNYTIGSSTSAGAGPAAAAGWANRKLYAAVQDPGTFGISANVGWATMTIAIRPPG